MRATGLTSRLDGRLIESRVTGVVGYRTEDADIWIARPQTIRYDARLLAEEDRTAARALTSPRLADRFMARRAAQRAVLSSYTGQPGASLAFGRVCEYCGDRTHGKPRLIGAPAVQFSASSCQSLIVIAVSIGAEVGADIADVAEVSRVERTAYLGADELVAPIRADAVDLAERWTAKEAYAKLIGIGLALDPREITPIQDGTGRPAMIARGYAMARVSWWTVAGQRSVIAVARWGVTRV